MTAAVCGRHFVRRSMNELHGTAILMDPHLDSNRDMEDFDFEFMTTTFLGTISRIGSVGMWMSTTLKQSGALHWGIAQIPYLVYGVLVVRVG